MGIADGAQR